MEKGFLLDKEMLASLSLLDEGSARKLIDILENLKIPERVITKQLFSNNFEKIRSVLVNGENKMVIEKFFINLGYSRTEIESKSKVVDIEEELEETEKGRVKLLTSPAIAPKKVVVKDFVEYMRARYGQIRKILEAKGLENLTSIRRLGQKKESHTIIVSVLSKRVTKNKNLLLEVEDPTGNVRVLVNSNKNELFQKAKDLLVDDIVAFQVNGDSEWLFANELIFPEAGLPEKRKCDVDEWVAFTADLHIGSTMFLEENFLRFIKWLNGEEGDEKQREIAKKVRYLFLVGDNIDGVGVYPDQAKHLTLKDTVEQYNKLVELLKLIRKDVKIIMGPGQHDAVWLGVPQPIVDESWCPELHKMENLTLVPNPSLVEIDGGFKVLMYHGASITPIIDSIEDIRVNYGHNSPTRVVKEILKRRHLASMHGSMDYVPDNKKDSLVIETIPDIMVTADQHRPEVSAYNNILLIASSCWQSITPFEEKVGNNPDPCKVPIFNIKTREIKVLDFSDSLDEVDEQECGESEKEVVCEVKNG